MHVGRMAIDGGETENLALALEHPGMNRRRTTASPITSVKHGLQIKGRSADDLKHVGSRGLLLERFREVVGTLAQLFEQAGVLDGDDGLSGEILHQLDLLVGEWSHFGAVDEERAEQLVLFDHWHRDGGSRTTISERRARTRTQSLGLRCG